MPHRAVEQMPVISLRALLLRNRAGTRNAAWRGGDAWRLTKIVFWGVLLLIGFVPQTHFSPSCIDLHAGRSKEAGLIRLDAAEPNVSGFEMLFPRANTRQYRREARLSCATSCGSAASPLSTLRWRRRRPRKAFRSPTSSKNSWSPSLRRRRDRPLDL
jgi:hypothetical protein